MLKKLFFFLFLCITYAEVLSAEEIVIDFTAEQYGQPVYEGSQRIDYLTDGFVIADGVISVTVNKLEGNGCCFYRNTNGVTTFRVYKNSGITVTCSGGVITKMDITGSQLGQLTADGYDDGTFEGSAESIELVNGDKSTVQIKTLTITYENGVDDNRDANGDPSAPSGVYFGITAFNYLPEIMQMQHLTLQNKKQYKDFVNSRTTDDYTYLYYSAEQALKALKAIKYPGDLNNVTLITFTDGNDDGSLDVAPDKSWDDVAYQSYIDGLISNATVQGLKVDAYSIGLKGNDIGDYNYEMFKSNLKALATEPKDKHATEVGNMVEVEKTLNEILDNLETSWQNKKVSCNINMRATGDKIRFTLDKTRAAMSNNPDNSEVWIEGTFSRDDNSMNNIEYHGCTSSSGTKVVSKQVTIDGRTKYQFTFENLKDLKGNNLNVGEINFWHATASNPIWQPHTEFGQGSDAVTVVDRTSAAIMFVMDCSSSLGDDFASLKRVINDLIDRLVPDNSDSSIHEFVSDSETPVEFFTIQGQRVNNPSKGLYIVKRGNSVKKVVL